MKHASQFLKTAVIILAVFITSLSYAQSGGLDLTFGNNGLVTTDFNGNYDWGHGVVIQPDGKIIASGRTQNLNIGEAWFSMARYNTDGSLDQGFGTGGLVILNFGSNGSIYGSRIVLQPDGKIVGVGIYYNNTESDIAVIRFNGDGSLDTGFGNGGLDTINAGGYGSPSDLVLQADGKILVAASNDSDFEIIRLNPDGTPDANFGSNGLVQTNYGGVINAASALTLQQDGKIIVTGVDFKSGYIQQSFMTVRYNTDGSLDTGFGSNGIVIYNDSNNSDYANDVLLQSDGKIVVGGFTQMIFSDTSHMLMVRYNSDGTLDTGFGNNGAVVAGGPFSAIQALVIQTDNKIVAAGWIKIAQNVEDFLLARFNSDGTIDTQFGANGFIDTPGAGQIYDAALQTDGKLLAVGSIEEIPGDLNSYDFSVARYILGSLTPVELTSFTGYSSGNEVILNWTTSTESNNGGFEIQRSEDKINWTRIGFSKGNGTTSKEHNYNLTDNISAINSNILYYRLKQFDFDGSSTYSKIIEVTVANPKDFSLDQNYPNPFNPSTTIRFSVPQKSFVSLKVYDLLGKEVADLIKKELQAGSYKTNFNASNLASGVYLYRLNAGGFVQTKKLMLMK